MAKAAKKKQAKKKAVVPSYVEYYSNNRGGSWWLSDDNWKDLENAGWIVAWRTLDNAFEDGNYVYSKGAPKLVPRTEKFGCDKDGRWLGALATGAYKPNCTDLDEAVREWERITGMSSTDAGCPCCGPPHRFILYVDGEYIRSGPNTSYEASW